MMNEAGRTETSDSPSLSGEKRKENPAAAVVIATETSVDDTKKMRSEENDKTDQQNQLRELKDFTKTESHQIVMEYVLQAYSQGGLSLQNFAAKHYVKERSFRGMIRKQVLWMVYVLSRLHAITSDNNPTVKVSCQVRSCV